MGRAIHRRPPKYKKDERKELALLIRRFGARGAREKLSRRVCLGTLLKVAQEFRIKLPKGRRPKNSQLRRAA